MKVALNLLAAVAGSQVPRARAFMERFAAASHAQLIVLKDREMMPECVTTANRIVVNVPIGLGRFQALRRMRWENLAMAEVVRNHRADVFLTFSHYLPTVRKIAIPSVVGVSNLAPFSDEARTHESFIVKRKLSLLRRTILSSAERATRVLALSETCRQILQDEGIAAEKIAVTPNGVDVYWEQRGASTDVLERNAISRPYMLYVSHFYRYKNHSRLVSAYAQLPDDVRRQHQLVFVGRPYDQAYFDELRSEVDKLGLVNDVVIIPGESGDRLRDLYQRSRLFVFASLIENSPAILLEAMMAGAPVVASALKPMPEFGGSAAEYFDPLDAVAMSKSLGGLLSDAPRRHKLSELSRAQARRFTWDAFYAGVMRQVETAAKQAWPSSGGRK